VRIVTWAVLVVLACASLLSCSKSEEPATVAEQHQLPDELTPEERERPSWYPPENPLGGLSLDVLDTLRVRKKLHKITRDQYWQDRGGVLANDDFEVWYPRGRTTVTHGMRMFDEIMPAKRKFESVFGRAPAEPVVVLIPQELDVYQEWTGQDYWHYSQIRGDTLVFQPIYILVKRGLATIGVTHEYFQWAIGRLTGHGAPRWLEEGLASYYSDEAEILKAQMLEFPERRDDMTVDIVEGILDVQEEKGATRIAYYRSYLMVQQLVDTYGEPKVVEVVTLLAEGRALDEAFRGAFGKSYQDVLIIASNYTIEI